MVAYVRLYERGKTEVAFASVLARYAIAQIRDGRRVGKRLNILDVSSEYAQARKQIVLERLDHYDRNEEGWVEAVVEDHHTPVADQVAFRLDFPHWLSTFTRRDRKIAELLAAGHNTGDVARRFHLSPGRISQKRREYAESGGSFTKDRRTRRLRAKPLDDVSMPIAVHGQYVDSAKRHRSKFPPKTWHVSLIAVA